MFRSSRLKDRVRFNYPLAASQETKRTRGSTCAPCFAKQGSLASQRSSRSCGLGLLADFHRLPSNYYDILDGWGSYGLPRTVASLMFFQMFGDRKPYRGSKLPTSPLLNFWTCVPKAEALPWPSATLKRMGIYIYMYTYIHTYIHT